MGVENKKSWGSDGWVPMRLLIISKEECLSKGVSATNLPTLELTEKVHLH